MCGRYQRRSDKQKNASADWFNKGLWIGTSVDS